jgi:hypothetical protein
MLRLQALTPRAAAARDVVVRGLGARGLAKQAKKGGKGADAAAPAAASTASGGLEKVVTGLNILKDGSDPVVKASSEYPDWVFELCALRTRALPLHAAPPLTVVPPPHPRRHKPLPSLDSLAARHKSDPDSLSPQERRRLIRQWNRKRIKEGNLTKAL